MKFGQRNVITLLLPALLAIHSMTNSLCYRTISTQPTICLPASRSWFHLVDSIFPARVKCSARQNQHHRTKSRDSIHAPSTVYLRSPDIIWLPIIAAITRYSPALAYYTTTNRHVVAMSSSRIKLPLPSQKFIWECLTIWN